jgi:hypothetical protein
MSSMVVDSSCPEITQRAAAPVTQKTGSNWLMTCYMFCFIIIFSISVIILATHLFISSLNEPTCRSNSADFQLVSPPTDPINAEQHYCLLQYYHLSSAETTASDSCIDLYMILNTTLDVKLHVAKLDTFYQISAPQSAPQFSATKAQIFIGLLIHTVTDRQLQRHPNSSTYSY